MVISKLNWGKKKSNFLPSPFFPKESFFLEKNKAHECYLTIRSGSTKHKETTTKKHQILLSLKAVVVQHGCYKREGETLFYGLEVEEDPLGHWSGSKNIVKTWIMTSGPRISSKGLTPPLLSQYEWRQEALSDNSFGFNYNICPPFSSKSQNKLRSCLFF